MVLGPDRRGLKVTYCTDTRPVPVIAEYAAGSDLFICEGMYGEKEKASKAREYKHMTFYEAAALAKEAKPGQLWLTHYSPSLTRPDDIWTRSARFFRGLRLQETGGPWNWNLMRISGDGIMIGNTSEDILILAIEVPVTRQPLPW